MLYKCNDLWICNVKSLLICKKKYNWVKAVKPFSWVRLASSPGPTQKIGKRAWLHLQTFSYVLNQYVTITCLMWSCGSQQLLTNSRWTDLATERLQTNLTVPTCRAVALNYSVRNMRNDVRQIIIIKIIIIMNNIIWKISIQLTSVGLAYAHPIISK